MYDNLTIIGNLGSDPELRYLPDGTPVASFSIAANRTWKDKSGEKVTVTVWYRVSAWRRLAEVVEQYLHKGDLVHVTGQLNPDKETGGPRVWEGKDGVSHAQYEVTASRVDFLNTKRSKDDGREEGRPDTTSVPVGGIPDDDEIPF